MINRLLGIIYILMKQGTVTASELAERFEVSIRTIYRDLDTLSAAGIPVYAKKAKNAVKINATGSAYEPKYTREELIKMVYGFKLTDEEKKSILYEIGVYK